MIFDPWTYSYVDPEVEQMDHIISQKIKLATAAERERCAKIAENHDSGTLPQGAAGDMDTGDIVARLIAKEIRNGI